MSKKFRIIAVLCFAITLLIAGCGGVDNDPSEAASNEPIPQYPIKPVELVVPFGAGGSHDLHSRAVVSIVSNYMSSPMVVTLKPGGSGATGSQYVATSKPDGYTLLFGGSGPNGDLHHVRDLPYKREDFVPIAKINHSPLVVAVLADSPFKTLDDIIDYAKKHPGELTYSSGGAYSATHIPVALLCAEAGIDMVHVPFDGGGPATMALLGGQVDLIGNMTTPLRPLFQAGKIRVLAVSDSKRIDDEVFKDVPTMKELGYDVDYKMWRTVLAPKDTPEEIVNYLREAFKKLVEDPSFLKLIDNMGEKVIYLDGPDFQAEWDAEFEKNGPVIRKIVEQETK